MFSSSSDNTTLVSGDGFSKGFVVKGGLKLEFRTFSWHSDRGFDFTWEGKINIPTNDLT